MLHILTKVIWLVRGTVGIEAMQSSSLAQDFTHCSDCSDSSACQSQRAWSPRGAVHVPSALVPVIISLVPEKIMPQRVTTFLISPLIPLNS